MPLLTPRSESMQNNSLDEDHPLEGGFEGNQEMHHLRVGLFGMLVLAVAMTGCQSGPARTGLVSNLHDEPTPVVNNQLQPVVHKSSQPDHSVVLEGDPADEQPASDWKSLFNPFQKKWPRIPLPLSPKTANGDDRTDEGF